MTFAAGLLLLVWVVASILTNGIALLHYFTKLRGLELVGYGAAAGVLLHALLGCGIAAAPAVRWAFVAMLIALTLLSAVYFVTRRIGQEFSLALSRPSKVSLALWGLLLVLSLGLLHVDVRLPEHLPEGGIYVFRTHTTNVKIQQLTSLPADNYIPFAVAEFFLRGVSFKKERPILPANEVSNRTILMSLVALPFRVTLGAPRDYPQLGTVRYLDRDWPDVSKLNTGGYFEQFAVVGLVLNSLMLLGLFVFCSSLGANSILPLATLLYLTNPYFLAQTIYTWPKALAGFFILLAWTSIRSGHGPIIVAVLLALACHSHPYAIVFAGCAALFYLTQWRREKSPPVVVIYLLVFVLLLAPWIIWTRFVLQIPSDLVMQNFAGPGTEAAWASPMNFAWIRLSNLFYLIGSMIFTVYPFEFREILNYWLFCVPGIVGLVLIYPALAQSWELPKPRPWLWYGLLGPALLILAVYSCPALPALHGYQPLLGVLLFFGVWWLSRHCTQPVWVGLVCLQLLFNLSLVLARGLITGALS
jgi:hypothetical protein